MTYNPGVLSCIFGVFVASILSGALLVHADDRQPIPDEAAQKEAAALVQEVFGKEIDSATTSGQKLALTKKLLEEASRPDTTPAGRYALLQIALDSAPDATAAMPIVDEMAKHFQIDSLKAKASTVWRMSNDARTSSQHSAVAEAALRLVDESVDRDAYDPAIKLAEIAVNAAQKARDGKLTLEVRTKAVEVRKLKADFENVKEAMAVLEKDPTNAEANLKVGTYKCLVKGDWEDGIPMLALGTDEVLKGLAVQELKMPVKSDEQVALADGWYELAQKSKEANKERMLQRAGLWYGLSLKSEPTLARLVKAKVEKRLSELPGNVSLDSNKDQASKISFLSAYSTEGKVSLGQWQFKDGKLMGWATPKAAKITIGEIPFEQYDLLVDFVLLKRKDDGFGDLIFYLPRVGCSLFLRTTASNRTIIGFNLEDARTCSILNGRLVLGKPYNLAVRVRGDGSKVEILLDHKQIKSLEALPGVKRSPANTRLSVTLSPNVQVVLGTLDVVERSDK